jgi:hypothetical protein
MYQILQVMTTVWTFSVPEDRTQDLAKFFHFCGALRVHRLYDREFIGYIAIVLHNRREPTGGTLLKIAASHFLSSGFSF